MRAAITTIRKGTALFAAVVISVALPQTLRAEAGKAVYDKTCSGCHNTGAAGAPKFGQKAEWEPLLATGRKALIANTLKGKGAMPAKGGDASLSEADITAAVDYMLRQLLGGGGAKAAAPAAAVKRVAQAEPAPKRDAVVAKPKPTAAKPKPKRTKARGANRFNRLMKPASKRNPPPAKDGIHDPAIEETHLLQHPKEAFNGLDKTTSGNRVDWVAALEKGHIEPRFDRVDGGKEPVLLDLNIVREVKGSMPDVVYPHKEHTEWLDCSNCHPALFIPKKGANQISMASIMLGEKCGVCHGKVAFPVADCRRCHSKKK